MKLLIISNEENYEISRLLQECIKLKITHQLVHPKELFDKKTDFIDFSHILIRQIKGDVRKVRRFVKKAFQKGKIIVDEKIAFGKDRNKLQNYVLFKKAGLFVPYTFKVTEKNLDKIKKFRNKFVVLKPLTGKRGHDIFRVKRTQVKRFVHSFLENSQDFLMQEFVPLKKELRVLVVGNKVLGAILKDTDNWIHNFSMGAIPKKYRITKKIKEVCLHACKTVQTEIAGVDLGFIRNGFFVIEVNRSPGFAFFEQTTNKNVARKIIRYLEKKTNEN